MYEDGGPPTLCQPASQQGGGEEVKTWQEEPGGVERISSQSLVGGVLGSMGKFLFSFTFIKKSIFNHL